MLALPAPHVSPGFPPLAVTGGQTVLPGGLTMHGTKAGGPTATPGGQTTPSTRLLRLMLRRLPSCPTRHP
jgi:hypothetical protein